MNNARTFKLGNDKKIQIRKTEETAQAGSRVRKMDGKAKRCAGGSERQKKSRSNFHASDGILRTSFLPKLRETNRTAISVKSVQLERDFFQSLSGLTDHYSVEPYASDKFTFPYNINMILSDLKKQLKNTVLAWDNVRLMADSKRVYLTSEERLNTGTVLFYIPVLPLFLMLHDRRRKKAAHLLLSVFSYLYHIVDIPYYMQENSYLYWEYEMLNDWIIDEVYETAEGEQDCRFEEIALAKYVGKNMEQKIFNYKNLDFFDMRVNSFIPKDDFDRNCLDLARKALKIYRDNPDANIFRNASSLLDESGEDVDEQIISMEKYLSFYADNRGWLASTLFDCVNNELQEYGEIQEPSIIKTFDGNEVIQADLSFETRTFDLLHEIIDLLNDYRNFSDEKF